MRKAKYFFMGFVAAAVIVAMKVTATGAPVANIFNAGDTAVAADVNANFQELADRIDANTPATYDFHDYIAANTVTQKIFNITHDSGSWNREARSYTFTGSGNAVDIDVTRTRYLDSSPATLVLEQTFSYHASATELTFESREVFDPSTHVSQSVDTIDDPVTMLTSTMSARESWGGASHVTVIPAPGNTQLFMQKRELMAVEDVTVLAGSYTGCLKIFEIRDSVTIGGGNRISWHCPGVGMVKRLQFRPDGQSPRIYELASIS